VTRYIGRRLLGVIPLVLGVATILFFVVNLAPGDPALRYVSPNLSAETVEQIRVNMGLDRPVHVRYVKWMAGLARGDLGYSFTENRPVLDVIKDILPNTLILSATAVGIAFILGVGLGVFQAVRQYSLLDNLASFLALFFYSMPSFWLALMMILTFGLFARNVWEWPIWFPASGMMNLVEYPFMTPLQKLQDRILYLVLPATSLALVLAAGIARFTRGSMLEVIRQDFVRTARAKGLSEPVVVMKHALRNGLIPVITLLGLYLPLLFSGTVFIESVFAWPGMGKLIVDGISQRDYPVIMGASLIFANMVVIGNLIADLLYAIVDPRIRYD
jgi:peptide/nickel transport system permease protein